MMTPWLGSKFQIGRMQLMNNAPKLSPGAAKLLRAFMNRLAEEETRTSPQEQETLREARIAIWLAFFAKRDDAGKIIYEHRARRSGRGITPNDPREAADLEMPAAKKKKPGRKSRLSRRAIDLAQTYIALTSRRVMTKRRTCWIQTS
jgi:hypothetical protein